MLLLVILKNTRKKNGRFLPILFPFAEQIGIAKQILSGMVYLGKKNRHF